MLYNPAAVLQYQINHSFILLLLLLPSTLTDSHMAVDGIRNPAKTFLAWTCTNNAPKQDGSKPE